MLLEAIDGKETSLNAPSKRTEVNKQLNITYAITFYECRKVLK